jgi:hypothetical protein
MPQRKQNVNHCSSKSGLRSAALARVVMAAFVLCWLLPVLV